MNSRSEEFYGEGWELKVLNESQISDKRLLYLYCPIHKSDLMTPIKIKNTGYGEAITLQCHHSQGSTKCLIIANIYRSLDKPLELLPGDMLAHETLNKIIDLSPQPVLDLPNFADLVPPSPYKQKGHIRNIIWTTLWSRIAETGVCTYSDLQEKVLNGQTKGSVIQLDSNMISGEWDEKSNWISEMSGFIITKTGEGPQSSWRVIGRLEQPTKLQPFADKNYRKKMGWKR